MLNAEKAAKTEKVTKNKQLRRMDTSSNHDGCNAEISGVVFVRCRIGCRGLQRLDGGTVTTSKPNKAWLLIGTALTVSEWRNRMHIG